MKRNYEKNPVTVEEATETLTHLLTALGAAVRSGETQDQRQRAQDALSIAVSLLNALVVLKG